MRHNENPLSHFLDCLMATVESLGDLSRPPKAELLRHCVIIQKGVNTLRAVNATGVMGRVEDVVVTGDVVSWFNQNGPNVRLSPIDVTQVAASEEEMISEMRAFIVETIENPSAKLATPGEQRRHNTILKDIDFHILCETGRKRMEQERAVDTPGMSV